MVSFWTGNTAPSQTRPGRARPKARQFYCQCDKEAHGCCCLFSRSLYICLYLSCYCGCCCCSCAQKGATSCSCCCCRDNLTVEINFCHFINRATVRKNGHTRLSALPRMRQIPATCPSTPWYFHIFLKVLHVTRGENAQHFHKPSGMTQSQTGSAQQGATAMEGVKERRLPYSAVIII